VRAVRCDAGPVGTVSRRLQMAPAGLIAGSASRAGWGQGPARSGRRIVAEPVDRGGAVGRSRVRRCRGRPAGHGHGSGRTGAGPSVRGMTGGSGRVFADRPVRPAAGSLLGVAAGPSGRAPSWSVVRHRCGRWRGVRRAGWAGRRAGDGGSRRRSGRRGRAGPRSRPAVGRVGCASRRPGGGRPSSPPSVACSPVTFLAVALVSPRAGAAGMVSRWARARGSRGR
jgi:hypothetical protein